jgi:hypothetical protein
MFSQTSDNQRIYKSASKFIQSLPITKVGTEGMLIFSKQVKFN